MNSKRIDKDGEADREKIKMRYCKPEEYGDIVNQETTVEEIPELISESTDEQDEMSEEYKCNSMQEIRIGVP